MAAVAPSCRSYQHDTAQAVPLAGPCPGLTANPSGTSRGKSSLGPARTGNPDTNVCRVGAFSADLLSASSQFWYSDATWSVRRACHCGTEIVYWQVCWPVGHALWLCLAALASGWHSESGPARAPGSSRFWGCPQSSSLKVLSRSRTPAPSSRRRSLQPFQVCQRQPDPQFNFQV